MFTRAHAIEIINYNFPTFYPSCNCFIESWNLSPYTLAVRACGENPTTVIVYHIIIIVVLYSIASEEQRPSGSGKKTEIVCKSYLCAVDVDGRSADFLARRTYLRIYCPAPAAIFFSLGAKNGKRSPKISNVFFRCWKIVMINNKFLVFINIKIEKSQTLWKIY